MDKLIDLESIKSIVSSVVNENKMTDEEISECGAVCGCGTTTADLGAEVQYLGDKKKTKKDSDNQKEESVLEESNVEDQMNSIMADIEQKHFEMSEGALSPIGYLLYLGEIGKQLSKIENKFTSEDYKELVEILNMFNAFYEPLGESTLQEDEVEEMARGVLAPQEQARRDYIAEYPEYKDVLKRADQFMKQVLNNPEAPGYEKYVKHFANLLKNGNRGTWSNVSSAYELNTDKRANNKKLATDYANTILNHRKNMGKASYASKGTMNAYQRNIVKRGSYYKPGRDMVEPEQTASMSLGQQIADQYNSVPVEQSNSVLAKFFKSADWNNLSASDKYKTLKVINDEADLDMAGVELVNKAKMNIDDE